MTHEIQNETNDLVMTPQQEFKINISTCYSLLLWCQLLKASISCIKT